MKALGAAILEAIILHDGTAEVLRRLADPIWFQSLGNVLGFDWHSSGLTTVVLAAIKEGTAPRAHELGFFVVGGKGKTARQTPQEIETVAERHALPTSADRLATVSRMTAKVDSALVQDRHTIYHHTLLFDRLGNWVVIQQGMNVSARTARRYHWWGGAVRGFTLEPHSGVAGSPEPHVLDLTAKPNLPVQAASLSLVNDAPATILSGLARIQEGTERHLILPRYHAIPSARRLDRILHRLYERRPENYEELVATEGVGEKTIRALAMVAELVTGARPTFHDPVRYSFAHGGKDGHPFPVSRHDYDHSIQVLEEAIRRSRLGVQDKMAALRRLAGMEQPMRGLSRS